MDGSRGRLPKSAGSVAPTSSLADDRAFVNDCGDKTIRHDRANLREKRRLWGRFPVVQSAGDCRYGSLCLEAGRAEVRGVGPGVG